MQLWYARLVPGQPADVIRHAVDPATAEEGADLMARVYEEDPCAGLAQLLDERGEVQQTWARGALRIKQAA